MTTTDDTTTRTGPAAADPFEACLMSVRTTLAELGQVPAWTLSEEAVQARLTQALQVRAQLEAVTARLVASVTGREIPRVTGASSTRAWLMSTHGLSVQDAARLVNESAVHDTDDLVSGRTAPTRAAWAAGLLSAEQAVLIATTIDGVSETVTDAAVVSLQHDLARLAQTLSFVQLQSVCRHAVEVIDPEGADAALAEQLENEEARAMAMCELKMRRSGNGWTGFSGRIPDAHADMWKRCLEGYLSPRHERAVASTATDSIPGDGRNDLDLDGDGPQPSYPQRLGRAFAELIEHLPTSGLPQQGMNSSTVVINIDFDNLKDDLGEALLDTGTPMSPGQVRLIACNATILPMVLGGDSAILDLGLGQRLFNRYQRLALAVRDQGCIWAGCERPASWCEAHHIVFWSNEGPTDLANGCLLCPFHHHLVHSREGWQIRMAPDGVAEVIPPLRLDPSRTPRRHGRFRHPSRC